MKIHNYIYLLLLLFPLISTSQVRILQNLPTFEKPQPERNEYRSSKLDNTTAHSMRYIFGSLKGVSKTNFNTDIVGKQVRLNQYAIDRINEQSILVYRIDQTYNRNEIDARIKSTKTELSEFNAKFSTNETEIRKLISESLKSFDLNEEAKGKILESLEKKIEKEIERRVDDAISTKIEIFRVQLIEELLKNTSFINGIQQAIKEK